MRHNYVPAPYSIYKGFHPLRPGHFLILANGDREPRIEAYWSARDAAETKVALVLSRAVVRRLLRRSSCC